MDVKNFTQMAHLLSSKQVIQAHPAFDRLVLCVMLYNGMCQCGGNTDRDKSNKGAECNRIYREAIGAVDSIKAHLFMGCSENTISFYVDNVHLIKTIHR